jgi:predicted Na+-dependent transporter
VALVFYLAWIIAIALVVIGIYALAAPNLMAHRYGVSTEDHSAAAFVRAAGVRDIALGILLAATAYFRFIPLLIVLAVAGIVVSVVDIAVVSHHGHGPRHSAHALHASGIVAFLLVIAMALFAVGR